MAAFTHSSTYVPHSGIAARLRSAASAVVRWFEARRERAAVLHELAQCDDRDLRDMMITRYDFEAIARGTYRRG